MRTRWFGDLADGEQLDATLLRLVGGVSRMLDRLQPPAVVPGEPRVEVAGSAIVLPHRGMPGCSLVVQVAEWSSSVGCWWSFGPEPLAGPVAGELSAEFPMRPDGLGRAVAWLEEELRRPVVERVRRYGVAHRREWAVVMDDQYELPVGSRWQPGWRPAAAAPAAADGARARAASWLLGVAVAAAVLHWSLDVARPELDAAAWLGPVSRALEVGAFAALLVWFGVAGRDRPARVRVPVLAGLLLTALGQGLQPLVRSAELPPPVDSAQQALALFLRDWLPSVFGLVALACFLVAFLAVPGRGALGSVWPVAAGLAWGIDLAFGLVWLMSSLPGEADEAALAWYGLLVSAMRAVALGLAITLLFAVLERRPAMSRGTARAAVWGAVLLGVWWSVTSQYALSWLTGLALMLLVQHTLAFAVISAPAVLGLFAGTALLAVAATDPPASPAPTQPAPGRSPAGTSGAPH